MLRVVEDPVHPGPGGTIRTLAVSLVGVAALVAGLALVRHHRKAESASVQDVPPGETLPTEISLERLREAGY